MPGRENPVQAYHFETTGSFLAKHGRTRSHLAKKVGGMDSRQTQATNQMDRSISQNPMFRKLIRRRCVRADQKSKVDAQRNCDVACACNHLLARDGIRIEMRRESLNGIHWILVLRLRRY